MKNAEPFKPSKELEKKLEELNNIAPKKRGGRREGAGRKKKDGSDPKPIKPEPPETFPKPSESPRLNHTPESLLGASTASNESLGHLTRREVLESVVDKLESIGFDPVSNLVDMVKHPERYGLEGKDLIKINSELLKYIHPTKKSVEKKETKDYQINIVQRNFAICPDTGKVIDV